MLNNKNIEPMNWSLTSLSNILSSLESGSRPKGGVKGINDGIPSIGGEHLSPDGKFKFGNIRYVPEAFANKMSKGLIKENDLLIVKDGATTAKVSFVDKTFPYKTAFVNEHVFICRVSEQINPKLVFWYLWSQEGQNRILENFKGSAQGGITTNFALNTNIPLPPLNEQHRIVSKLEELFSELDIAVETLKKAKEKVKIYKQSVLKSAFEGRLLGNNKTINEETGLPEGWKNIILRDIIEDISYGTSKKCSYDNEGLPVLRIPNVINGSIDISDLKFASFTKDEIKHYSLQNYDILIIRSNGSISIVGKTAIVTQKQENFIFAGYLIRIRFNLNMCQAKFFNYQFQSMQLRNQIEFKAKSTSGVNNINANEIQDLNVVLPPIAEQNLLVSEIETRFSEAENLEKTIEIGLKQAENLRQSILKKAFEGRLVPQDPNDEPASELLEKIKKEFVKYSRFKTNILNK